MYFFCMNNNFSLQIISIARSFFKLANFLHYSVFYGQFLIFTCVQQSKKRKKTEVWKKIEQISKRFFFNQKMPISSILKASNCPHILHLVMDWVNGYPKFWFLGFLKYPCNTNWTRFSLLKYCRTLKKWRRISGTQIHHWYIIIYFQNSKNHTGEIKYSNMANNGPFSKKTWNHF